MFQPQPSDPFLEFGRKAKAEFKATFLALGWYVPRKHLQKPLVADGLKTMAQVAAKLGCSIKTLREHVKAGRIKYIDTGHGSKRPRRMFADADLNEFITNQSRKDVPCPSTSSSARHIGTSISSAEVIAFTA